MAKLQFQSALVAETVGQLQTISLISASYKCQIFQLNKDNCCRVFFFIAEVCLSAGSVQNSYHTKYRVYLGNTAPSCRSVRKGVFGAGAAFIILSGIVSELYYVCLTRAKDFEVPKDPGIRMSSL